MMTCISPGGTRTYGNLVWCLDDVGLSILQLVKLFKLKDSAILHSWKWWNGQKFMMKSWLFLATSSYWNLFVCLLQVIEHHWSVLLLTYPGCKWSFVDFDRYPFKLPESLCLSNNFSSLQVIIQKKKQSNSWRQRVLQGKMREASLGSVFSSSSGQQTGSFGWVYR